MKKAIVPVFAALLFAATAAFSQEPPPAALPDPLAGGGYQIRDFMRGLVFMTPTPSWSINAGEYSVSFTHSIYYDAYVSLKKSWYTVATPQEAYAKRMESLKSYLPGAQMLKENEPIAVGGTEGLSVTYKDPAQQKVYREIVFIHRGVPYELSFTVKEENFEKVKADFGAILRAIQVI